MTIDGQFFPEGHSNCFVCSAVSKGGLGIVFKPAGGGVLRGEWVAGERFQSHDGILHGGIIATLLDSVMTHWLLERSIAAVTGRLEIRYLHPIKIGSRLEIEGFAEKRAGRLYLAKASVRVDGIECANAQGRLMAEG